MNIERRLFLGDVVQKEGALFGYGAVFNSESKDLGGFIETIDERAFDKVLKDPNILILANHDDNLILGRTGAGTAEIGVDERGLWYKVSDPPSSRADIVEAVQRGDLVGSSFGFIVDEEEWTEKEGEVVRRHIRSVKRLFDLGPVAFPAYPDTTTAMRNMESFKKELHERRKREGYNNIHSYKIKILENQLFI